MTAAIWRSIYVQVSVIFLMSGQKWLFLEHFPFFSIFSCHFFSKHWIFSCQLTKTKMGSKSFAAPFCGCRIITNVWEFRFSTEMSIFKLFYSSVLQRKQACDKYPAIYQQLYVMNFYPIIISADYQTLIQSLLSSQQKTWQYGATFTKLGIGLWAESLLWFWWH